MPHPRRRSSRFNRPAPTAFFAAAGAALFCVAGLSLFLSYSKRVTKIQQVLAEAAELNGQQVRIQGAVRNCADFLGTGAYEVEDSTGKIWVTTQHGAPTLGCEVTVTGKVNKFFQLGTVQAVVLMEESKE